MHIIAAKAIAFKEALSNEFVEYQKQVVKNSKVLSEAFIKEGLELVTGGTDNHLMLLNLINTGITGKELEHMLDEVNITVNKNAIPNDPQKPFVTSGIRIGTPAVTTRGMKESEMKEIAKIIKLVIDKKEQVFDEVRERVINMCKKYPIYKEDVLI